MHRPAFLSAIPPPSLYMTSPCCLAFTFPYAHHNRATIPAPRLSHPLSPHRPLLPLRRARRLQRPPLPLCPTSPASAPPPTHASPTLAAPSFPAFPLPVVSHPRLSLRVLLAAPAVLAATAAATPFLLTAILLTAATLGLLSVRHPWGAALSAPVVTTLLTLLLANTTPLPAVHPVYNFVTAVLVPLAVPLLLFGADLRRVLRDTSRLVTVFLVGTASTLLGTLAAWRLVPITAVLGATDAWKIAAALCARHIGGAVNYVAVAEATAAGPEAVTAALAADNVITALYFLLLLILARGVLQPPPPPPPPPVATVVTKDAEGATVGSPTATAMAPAPPPVIGEDMSPTAAAAGVSVQDAGVALSLSAGMCAVGTFVDALLPFRLGPIPVITAIALVLATAFPRFFDRYRPAAAAVGVFFMQIFFAATGAGGSIASVMAKAPLLLLFSAVQLAVHLATFLAAGQVCKFQRSEILIASNANVGGPTTAAGMAAAKQWDRLVIPALLIGVFGYSIATFVSLALGHFVLKPV